MEMGSRAPGIRRGGCRSLWVPASLTCAGSRSPKRSRSCACRACMLASITSRGESELSLRTTCRRAWWPSARGGWSACLARSCRPVVRRSARPSGEPRRVGAGTEVPSLAYRVVDPDRRERPPRSVIFTGTSNLRGRSARQPKLLVGCDHTVGASEVLLHAPASHRGVGPGRRFACRGSACRLAAGRTACIRVDRFIGFRFRFPGVQSPWTEQPTSGLCSIDESVACREPFPAQPRPMLPWA